MNSNNSSTKEAGTHRWNTADTITSVRIVASLFLLFPPLGSVWFLTVYTIAGLTDALDGWLARRTGTASQFAALHTWLNRLTGLAVFLLPYVLAVFPGVTYSWAVCLLALAAAAEEWMIHLCRAEYCADRRSFFALKWRKVKNDTGTNCRNRPV